jgi:hypothetical protein
MPGPLAPLLGLFLGIVFAWSAREDLIRAHGASWLGSRALVTVSLFSVLVFAPVSAYFLAFEADWSYAYYIDTRRIPSAVQLGLVLIDAASVPLGFGLAMSRARTRRIGSILPLGVPILFVVLASALWASSRLRVEASYAQFHGDFGVLPVAGGPLGYALLWMDSLLTIAVVWTIRRLRQTARVKPA